MIQLPNIQIENNAPFNFGSSHYRVKIDVPGEIGEVIGETCQSARTFYFGGVAKLVGETVEVYDFEFDSDGLLWADTIIGSTHVGVMRNDDGSFTLSIICEKIGETDDYLDYREFERRMNGVLPDNFWIEPAAIIRKLLAAVKH